MAHTFMTRRLSPGGLSCAYPRAATILGAVVATLTIYLITRYGGQVELTMQNGATTITAIDVLIGTLVPGLGAWGLLSFLERRTDRAWPIFRGIAIAVLIVSLLGPLGADEALGKTALSIMHVIAGVIIIKGFSHTARR